MEKHMVDGGFLEIEDLMGIGIMRMLIVMENSRIELPDGDYTVVGLWSDDTGSIDLQVQFYSAKWRISESTGCYSS